MEGASKALEHLPSPAVPSAVRPATIVGPVRADFWRCHKCARLCTGLEMQAALGIGGSGSACPCGSMSYRASNLPWYGWFLPRVLKFAVLRLRGLA